MGGLGVLPQKIFRFFILQKHILSIFWSRIPLKLLGFIRNKVISFLFFPERNILAISLPILFPCTFPCKCLNFLLQGNFLASGSPDYNPRANGAKRRSGRKPGARVTNRALAKSKVGSSRKGGHYVTFSGVVVDRKKHHKNKANN